jgi:hypothetical protein
MLLFVMLRAIYLNDNSRRRGIKINNERTDRLLTVKLNTHHLLAP